ncbi:MAG: peptidase S8, partial [Paracoccaceae bacterium]
MTKHTLPPRYFWLWHLAALKVIDADFGPKPEVPDVDASAVRDAPAPQINSTVWDKIGGNASATAALIDTGVSRAHPNLASRIDTLRSIDLTSHRHGAQTLPVGPGTLPTTREEKRAFFGGLDLTGLHPLQLEPDELEYLEAMVAEARASEGVVRRMIDPEETFASHGTACAGLMVGEP